MVVVAAAVNPLLSFPTLFPRAFFAASDVRGGVFFPDERALRVFCDPVRKSWELVTT